MCTTQAVDVDGEGLETPEDTTAGTYRFCLYVTLDNTEDDTETRSEAVTRASEYQTGDEKEINTLTVFFTDINSDGTESDVTFVRTFVYEDLTSTSSGYSISFLAKTLPGKKRIYVGANLRRKQIDAFKNGNNCAYSLEEQDIYKQPVQGVMDVDDDGYGSNIAMFCDTGQDIDISVDAKADYVFKPKNTFVMVRVVSKVQLLVAVYNNDTKSTERFLYKDSEGKNKYGWTRKDSIRYFLNTTNKKAYVMAQTETLNGIIYYKDPNYLAGDILSRENVSSILEEFLYNDINKMSDEDQIRFLKSPRCISPVRNYSTALASNASKEMKKGLYCMENLVYNDKDDIEDIDEKAYKVSTYMVIAVPFVPKYLWHKDSNGDFTNLNSEEKNKVLTFDAAYALLKDQSTDEITITDGTYWSRIIRYDDMNDSEKETAKTLEISWLYRFYNYSGMQLAIEQSNGQLTEKDFKKHNGGYDFYTAYVDPDIATDMGTSYTSSKVEVAGDISYVGRTHWGVRRNFFYRLLVDQIIGLGEFPIEVKSISTPWKLAGSQEIEINP